MKTRFLPVLLGVFLMLVAVHFERGDTVVRSTPGEKEEEERKEVQRTVPIEVFEDNSPTALHPHHETLFAQKVPTFHLPKNVSCTLFATLDIPTSTLSFTVVPDFNGALSIQCGYVVYNVSVIPVNDSPAVEEVREVVVTDADPNGVVVPKVLVGVSAGPLTALDEDNDSLYSPASCTPEGDALFSAEPQLHIAEMQGTVSTPTEADLHFTPSGTTGTAFLRCVIQDTAGGLLEVTVKVQIL